MNRIVGYHINASGRVQGVGFRYYCMEAARHLKLTGYVMNRDDGDVEIEVFGAEEKLHEFMAEITRKDRTFLVDNLETDEIISDKGYRDFTIRFY
jgi:acylphosphatase